MNLEKTRKQKIAYDRTVREIRDRFGSYALISHQVYLNSDKMLSGEAFRSWFVERRIPTHIVFVLYEIMDQEIDPLTLCPWLAEYVELKQ